MPPGLSCLRLDQYEFDLEVLLIQLRPTRIYLIILVACFQQSVLPRIAYDQVGHVVFVTSWPPNRIDFTSDSEPSFPR